MAYSKHTPTNSEILAELFVAVIFIFLAYFSWNDFIVVQTGAKPVTVGTAIAVVTLILLICRFTRNAIYAIRHGI
jgi:hypothetical protein